MQKFLAQFRKRVALAGPAWVCIAVICLIAALSGYHVELSPSDGFRFAPAASAAVK